MPFKSKAQLRWMFAAEERGELPKGTAKRWLKHTKNVKNLPEKAHKKESSLFNILIDELNAKHASYTFNTANTGVQRKMSSYYPVTYNRGMRKRGNLLYEFGTTTYNHIVDAAEQNLAKAVEILQEEEVRKAMIEKALLGAALGGSFNLLQGEPVLRGALIGTLLGAGYGLGTQLLERQ